ncbi:uncharacterized protein conserved in bacteria [Hahella chejuensis KCTC 2396]|uniref:Uncharacterized protein conserved in bacteria n=1 Tax=Hahella chejuensis (strain KCTC 2396) TaxID=349521 RepID=Q2S7G3_HAHCH|nr:hypothetical protein [Hahella chejuensis]ABC33411.1 uncharacterized protein conserved in bacteria [Hahella chejuensis KCTC 2396]
MDEEIKKIVLRMFPELSGNLHLPRLAKVVAISDPLQKPELCDRFRPRYAVDVRVLTPQGEEDPELPLYRCVPLPASYGGIERGQFGFPEPGTVVEVAFAYGLPDQPFIRTVLGQGLGAPGVQPGDLVWQHSEAVRQRVSAKGDWLRETHGDITDTSARRRVDALENQERYQDSLTEVSEHSAEHVGGVKTVEALGALKLLSGGHANLSAADNLNLTTAADLNQAIARDRKASIQGDDSATVGGSRSVTISGNDTQTSANKTINVQGSHTDIASAARQIQAQVIELKASAAVTIQAPAIAMGGGGVDVLQVIADLIGVVQELAATTASHTHGGGGSGAPSSSGSHSSQASRAGALKGQINGVMT